MSLPIQLQQSNKRARRPFAALLRASSVLVCFASGGLTSLSAQESWYKIELSIFSNEVLLDREQEQWQADRNVLDYPSEVTRLKVLGDVLLIDSLLAEQPELATELANTDAQMDELALLTQNTESGASSLKLASEQELHADAIRKVGPFPPKTGAPFKFLDFERDGYLRLPASLSDFAQTNRALRRSPEHRLLFHAVWRQAVLFEDEARAILIEGGERYGSQPELQGNLTIRFNENSDRVVLDADIWLTEFIIDDGRDVFETDFSAAGGDEEATELSASVLTWQLPELPATIADSPLQTLQNLAQTDNSMYRIQNVFHMLQSRAMRSNEFHYMDHPALGIVVQVEPYEVPALPEIETEFENTADFGLNSALDNEPDASSSPELGDRVSDGSTEPDGLGN